MSNKANLHFEDNTIAIITLCDKNQRNMLSIEMIKCLEQIYDDIRSNPEVKVVVLQAEGKYFCSGGDEDVLTRLAQSYSSDLPEEERVSIADTQFYLNSLAMDIPTISALQGHALGGGFAYGLHSDIIVFSETGLYASNFMKYGFTPGMGASYLLPKKLGHQLGTEMLFTANNYNGKTTQHLIKNA